MMMESGVASKALPARMKKDLGEHQDAILKVLRALTSILDACTQSGELGSSERVAARPCGGGALHQCRSNDASVSRCEAESCRRLSRQAAVTRPVLICGDLSGDQFFLVAHRFRKRRQNAIHVLGQIL